MSDEQTTPAEPTEPAEATTSHRTRDIGIAVAVVLLVVIGAVAWAVVSRLSGGGPQPETALPADTLAVASLDLDPSASQKIDALRTLRKFPDLRHQIGLSSTDDVRKHLFEEIIDQTACHLDYDSAIKPWLGSRVAVAAVPLHGQIAPAAVVQVSNAAKARRAMTTIEHCAGPGAGFGWSVGTHYMVVSRSTADARAIATAAAKHALAGDATYQHWRSEVGGRGELNFYVAPGAPGKAVDQILGSESALAGGALPGDLGSEERQLRKRLAHFAGAAGALRFSGSGTVELDVVADAGTKPSAGLTPRLIGADVTDLPSDTAAVFGTGVPRGVVKVLLHEIGSEMGDAAGDPTRALEASTGLHVPGDLQTLLGRGLTFSVGANPPTNVATARSAADVPLALTVTGDAPKIDQLLGTLQHHLEFSLSQQGIAERISGDHLILSTQQKYAGEIAKGGSLGSNATFTAVVPDASRSIGIVYAAMSDAWRRSLVAAETSTSGAKDAAHLQGDLQPLDAFGLSTWSDGSVLHVLARLTTH